jgi:hypothetical protein
MTDREYTPYQRGVIRRYYENRDAIRLETLQKLVSEIYLAAPGKKADRLWERALGALAGLGCPPSRVELLDRRRDPAELAEAVRDLF